MDRDHADALQTLAEYVHEAGNLLLEHLGAAGAHEAKSGTEIVTEMDRRSEDLLLAGLARAFPGDAVVAEESGDTGGHSGRTWYIDPLDGTTNYAHGHPFFAVSAACADDEGPVLGMVHAPALDATWLAARGGGARLERRREGTERDLGPLSGRPLSQALLATGFPYVRDDLVARNTDLIRRFLEAPCQGVRRDGSAALDLCHVASGVLDGYWEFRLRPWDTAAGTLIAREAGARVTAIDGAEVHLPADDILAAAPGLYESMRAVLKTASDRPQPRTDP